SGAAWNHSSAPQSDMPLLNCSSQASCTPQFIALRRQHNAVESDIASPEHHGLNRCLDVGLEAYRRYVGYGVLAFNLHQIGRRLLAQKRAAVSVAA
ncbi:MAG: hypothetical protein WCT12_21695, partial [Verrucomicrobiota bacterium]